MRPIAYIALASILWCCEEEIDPTCEEIDYADVMPLYIDSSCGDNTTAAIVEGVERFREMAISMLCRPLVEIIGTIVVDHSDMLLEKGEIACYHYQPEWYADHYDGLKGSAREGENIRLFLFSEHLTMSARTSLVMHELFHFVGVREHTSSPRDIMYTSGHGKTSYTAGDKKLFCRHFGCDSF